ncbi:hypothetical protein POL67_05825 [Polyangium sp. rjm3]|uniref:Uncharacterized protein n=1 Tax=Polyangium mundeleinium TaxID=2995306 RepID=A0ABT5EGB8_9BACT|nr:hypothetical protein [Polyangium mundeleinium]MDC0740855.1 hypothetical protein [Polyangium mundeleinium]
MHNPEFPHVVDGGRNIVGHRTHIVVGQLSLLEHLAQWSTWYKRCRYNAYLFSNQHYIARPQQTRYRSAIKTYKSIYLALDACLNLIGHVEFDGCRKPVDVPLEDKPLAAVTKQALRAYMRRKETVNLVWILRVE